MAKSKKKPTKRRFIVVWLVSICVGIALALLIMQPYFEAKTYNKFREPDQPQATYWDAVWADLRVTSE